jgi:multisubunit Na+/H+ antiporter MnhC subunit
MSSLLEQTANNFNVGMAAVVLAVFLLLIVVTGTDRVREWKGVQPVGRRVQLWSHANPVVAALMLGAIGALLAHFFGNQIVFHTQPNT